MTVRLSFLGAAGTVTGSRYLVETGGKRILVDCGLFQGFKKLRERNWLSFPVEPGSIDAVVLTHAHLDHSGYLPLLVRNGFRGPVFCTAATRDLCGILLPDSAFLNEKDAERANRYGYTRHRPARPLYDRRDADKALEAFVSRDFEMPFEAVPGIGVRFRRAGHILGAASIELTANGRRIVFSGDIGRYGAATMPDPVPFEEADALVVESTYGNRLHAQADPEDELGEIVSATLGRGGTVIIPAFAVGRAQTILYHLMRLKRAGRIPDAPVFLDSPMAIDASGIFCAHPDDQKLTAEECRASCAGATYTKSVEDSRAIESSPMAKIIVSASGMATGGRVLHHLKAYLGDPRSTVLFAGFQAGGTRGAALTGGADRIKIHGDYYPVLAHVGNLSALSGHADREELLRWMRGIARPPRKTFITHGEPEASEALRVAIAEVLGWAAEAPEHMETVEV